MAANNGTRDSFEWIKGKAAEGRERAAETPNQVARSFLFAGIAAFESKTPDAMTNYKAKPGGKGLALSRQENKLLEAATDIYGTPPTGSDMAFIHAVFCQVGLPRSKVKGREFMRQTGAVLVNVQAGYLRWPPGRANARASEGACWRAITVRGRRESHFCDENLG